MSTDEPVVRLGVATTGIFVVTAAVGGFLPEPGPLVAAVVSVVFFLAGCVAFMIGFLAGVGRSRSENVELPGLIFLSGSAPPQVRNTLLVLLAVQVVVAVAAASIRPFTETAFMILAPVWGLGLMTFWGGRHGSFSVGSGGSNKNGSDG